MLVLHVQRKRAALTSVANDVLIHITPLAREHYHLVMEKSQRLDPGKMLSSASSERERNGGRKEVLPRVSVLGKGDNPQQDLSCPFLARSLPHDAWLSQHRVKEHELCWKFCPISTQANTDIEWIWGKSSFYEYPRHSKRNPRFKHDLDGLHRHHHLPFLELDQLLLVVLSEFSKYLSLLKKMKWRAV